jgi:deferrochelatase/peroxidase EfeB
MKRTRDATECRRSPQRRQLLAGLSVAGGALIGGIVPAYTADSGASAVTVAPESDASLQRQPFYGLHQPGIITPRPASGMVAAFDVIADDRAGLERLFRTLTQRVHFLMQGGAPPKTDPKFPPPDSGILGPVVVPDNLTITMSLGASLFDQRFGLQTLKPVHLERMRQFPNDALDPDGCHGDLLLQFCANTPDTNIHALRDILKNLSDLLVLRWKQEGSVPVVPMRTHQPPESARNFLGFRDGSANPPSNDPVAMERIVWVKATDTEPPWAVGGTYQVVRIIRNFVERWDRTPLQEQERIIGHTKSSGAPFDGKSENDVPNYAIDPQGKVTPLDAHIRLANPRTPKTQENLILRRPFNYSNGVAKSGQLDMGLLFIAYQANLAKGFMAVQQRLNGEPLEEYIKPVGGGFFFALPGVKDQDDFLGRSLISAIG